MPLHRRLRLPLSPRATWLIVALAGLALAYGLYNPLYWALAGLPGFNLFRVPARWLALFALGAAMLAALGVESLRSHPAAPRLAPLLHKMERGLRGELDDLGSGRRNFRLYLPIVAIVGFLAVSTALTTHQNDGTPASLPTPITLVGWAAALVVLLFGLWRRWPLLLAGAALAELWLAASILPYNQLVPPDAYSVQRLRASYLIAAN